MPLVESRPNLSNSLCGFESVERGSGTAIELVDGTGRYSRNLYLFGGDRDRREMKLIILFLNAITYVGEVRLLRLLISITVNKQ